MTKQQFDALCERYTVAPDIALDSEKLCAALKRRDDAEVERILSEEF
jgi:hypothetical protein